MFQKQETVERVQDVCRGERGKTGAANGAHDDLVMAMAVAQAVRAEMMRGRLLVEMVQMR